MWYIILALIGLIYLLLNTIVPTWGTTGSYVIRPLLWIALGLAAFFLAQQEGKNIIKFKRARRWYLGKTPAHAGFLIGGFQLSMLIIVGIFAGFGRSPYSFTPNAILTNLFFVTSLLFGTELSRSYLINSKARSKKHLTFILIGSTIIFMLIQISYTQFNVLSFDNPVAALEFIGKTLITSLSINLLACYLSYLGGATASFAYMGTLTYFEWFSPILPDPHWTIAALIGTIAPAIGFILIQDSMITKLDKKQMRRARRKANEEHGGWTIVAIFSLIIVFFSFGYLGVQPTVIYSGSMSPTLQVGDIALIDEVDISEISEGDIVQYVSYDNVTLILHRLIEIYEDQGKTYYITKGDANDDPDFRPIEENRIIGKSIFTIPKLGWIQIMIKSAVKTVGIPI